MWKVGLCFQSEFPVVARFSPLQPSLIHVKPIDEKGQSYVKLCRNLQSSWTESVVIKSLDRRPPSHQDSSASRLSISLNILTPANHRPLTSLHLVETLREREREQRKRDGRQADHALQLSSIITFCNPAKREREREKKRWISLLLTTMQLLLQHAQKASAPPLSAGLQ